MPDVTDLLHRAVGPQSSFFDPGVVAARADVLRRRRTAIRAGAGAALAVAVLAVGLRLGPGTDAEGLDLQPATRAPSPAVGSRTPAPPSPAPGTAIDDGAQRPAAAPAPVGVTSTAPPPAARPVGTRPAVAPSPKGVTPRPNPSPAAEDDGTYPRQESCSVTTEAAVPDEVRTCRFTATREGGYLVRHRGGLGTTSRVEFDIVVRRGAGFTRYTTERCRSLVIEPGDRVSVSVRATAASEGTNIVDARAGAGSGC